MAIKYILFLFAAALFYLHCDGAASVVDSSSSDGCNDNCAMALCGNWSDGCDIEKISLPRLVTCRQFCEAACKDEAITGPVGGFTTSIVNALFNGTVGISQAELEKSGAQLYAGWESSAHTYEKASRAIILSERCIGFCRESFPSPDGIWKILARGVCLLTCGVISLVE